MNIIPNLWYLHCCLSQLKNTLDMFSYKFHKGVNVNTTTKSIQITYEDDILKEKKLLGVMFLIFEVRISV